MRNNWKNKPTREVFIHNQKKKGGLRFEIRLSIAKCSIVLNG